MNDKPVTIHGLPAALSSMYDPLGLGAPFLLNGCQIIQNLCRNNLSWNEPIANSSSYEWLKWRNQLMKLQDMNIIHCCLDYFLDACETGFGIHQIGQC